MIEKKKTYCRNEQVFPVVPGDVLYLCCCFSLVYKISTGVVVILLMESSLIFVELKQSRRRIFDAILNRSELRISSNTARNFVILRNKNILLKVKKLFYEISILNVITLN
jgi:hypothetical protein